MTTTLGAAFIANLKTNDLLFCSSTDGTHWTNNSPVHQFSKTTPSVAFFNFNYWVVFVDNTTNNNLLICSSPNGEQWTTFNPLHQTSNSAPSIVVFNHGLWLAFLANDNSNQILICSSPDGPNWGANTAVGQLSKTAPALAVFNNKLWMAFVETVASNDVSVCSSADGRTWSKNTRVGQLSKTAPSLTVFNNNLWMAFVANDNANEVLVCYSPDGIIWSKNISVGQTSKDAPSLSVLNNELCLMFIANDNANQILVCTSTDGTHWSSNTQMGQGGQLQFSNYAPAAAAAAVTTGTVRPRYEILSVVYAPPGTKGGMSKSSVTYNSGNSASTTVSTSRSFKAGVDVSVTAGNKVTSATSDFNFSDTATNSSSVQITKSQSYILTVPGPATDGIDHGEDQFILWLNPLLEITIDALGAVQWAMGVDGAEVLPVSVNAGELRDPSTMRVSVKLALTDAGLTETDYAQILATNPFASGSSAIDPDRFVACQQALNYEPPGSTGDGVSQNTYNLTNSVMNTTTLTKTIQYGVSVKVSTGIAKLLQLSTTGSMEWTNTSSSGTGSTSSLSATAVIGGPSSAYTSANIDVLVYWDTVFNTFMFAFPTQPAIASGTILDGSGKPIPNKVIELVAGTHTFSAVTGPNGSYRFYGAPTGPGTISIEGQNFPVSIGPAATKPVLRLASDPPIPPIKK